MPQLSDWTHIPIARIEDLRDAVLGAGLEATQMSTALLSGGLAFAERTGVLYSTGLINGQIALRGPLSENHLTIGVGLRMGAGTKHWLQETGTGTVGIFHAGDDHDALYTPGSLYATASLSLDHLEEFAANEDLVIDRRVLGGTGAHPRLLSPPVVKRLRHAFELVHSGPHASTHGGGGIGEAMVRAIAKHIGRSPMGPNQRGGKGGYPRIVRRAREYIRDHLSEPISLDDLAKASFASRRTLFRAFEEILDDTPLSYVRRLRLHRIRQDLASDEERACTIALVANAWGIGELGRMSGWYRELFGELPSETLARTYRGRADTNLARSA